MVQDKNNNNKRKEMLSNQFGANSLCEHMAPHICEQDIGFVTSKELQKLSIMGLFYWIVKRTSRSL
jgi:hypothetical protein